VYDYVTGVWAGEPDSVKRHMLCAALEDAVRKHDSEGCGVAVGALFDATDFDMGPAFQRAWSSVMCRPWPGTESGADFS
jgi:hypothetical protein